MIDIEIRIRLEKLKHFENGDRRIESSMRKVNIEEIRKTPAATGAAERGSRLTRRDRPSFSRQRRVAQQRSGAAPKSANYASSFTDLCRTAQIGGASSKPSKLAVDFRSKVSGESTYRLATSTFTVTAGDAPTLFQARTWKSPFPGGMLTSVQLDRKFG